jgi:hypothetical protein
MSRSSTWFLSFACLLVAGTGLVWSSSSRAAEEARVYAVTNWNATCGGSPRAAWDNMAQAWYDEITDDGFKIFGFCFGGHCDHAYLGQGVTSNGNVTNSKFADSNVVSWGRDRRDLDNFEAIMLAWHGSESGNDYRGSMRVNESGSGDCTLLRSEMRIGNGEADYVHLSSCNSMDSNQWGGWVSAYDTARQVDGFHGLMWIGNGLISNYEDFAEDAFDGAISSAWVRTHYVPDISGNDDQCPVAHTVGTSRNDVLTRLANDSYADRYQAPAASSNWWAVRYIRGCNPANESAL